MFSISFQKNNRKILLKYDLVQKEKLWPETKKNSWKWWNPTWSNWASKFQIKVWTKKDTKLPRIANKSPQKNYQKDLTPLKYAFWIQKTRENNGVLPGRVELQRPASLLCFSREAFGTSESHANCFSLEPKVIYPKYYKQSNESCTFAVFEAGWAVSAILKISSIFLKFMLL